MSQTSTDYLLFADITILVVEDNESELEELCELLSVYFKKCYSAIDGKDGLEKFVKYHPDIVLADYGMSAMNGLEMSEKIREIDDEIPIILHTVFANVDTFIKAINYKISGYVVKPTNARDLLDILARESKHILEKKELKKKNLLMQSILDEFPEPMMVSDLDHNVLFVNKQIKNNGFWQEKKAIKCYKALHGLDTFCDNPNHKCDSSEALLRGENVVHSHEVVDKNGEKTYLSIKTVPLKDENDKVYALLKAIQDKTNDKKRELELEYVANHDVLTGLPNRVLLNDRLNQAILRSDRSKMCFALLFIDFDRFKEVNDNYGHKVGDVLLQSATFRMKSAIRKVDTIARLGGDEFVAILENISDKQQIKNVAIEILDKMSLVFDIDAHIKLNITCSIGIDTYNPTQIKKPKEELLQNSDFAMYKAKKFGKNRFEFFQ
jgi:diguanylate cyclase (GGDEF)-like protein